MRTKTPKPACIKPFCSTHADAVCGIIQQTVTKTIMRNAFVTFLSMCLTLYAPNLFANTYQGRLVRKGICGQHVIEHLSLDSALEVDAVWVSSKQVTYHHVFTLKPHSICTFPSNIHVGDVFSFSLMDDAMYPAQCTRCEAYETAPMHAYDIVVSDLH